MTKSILELLRNKYRSKMIDVYKKTAKYYENFADKISKGEILTEHDFKELNDNTLLYIPYINENGDDDYISLDWIFSEGIEDDK